MALTLQVKNELATVPVQKLCCRRSEIAATLRFAGGIHLVQHRHLTIEAEVDTGGAARRLRQSIQEVFGFDTDLVVVNGAGLHSNTRYLIRMVRGGADLARLTGLLDRRGRPVRGLPVPIVGGGRCCQAAAWRRSCIHTPTHSSTTLANSAVIPSSSSRWAPLTSIT